MPTRARQRQDNDKKCLADTVLPVLLDHVCLVIVGPDVKGIIGMHRFNSVFVVVVVLFWCEKTITPH